MAMLKYRKKPATGRHSFRVGGKRFSVVPGDIIELPDDYSLGGFGPQYDLLSPRQRRSRKVAEGKEEAPQKNMQVIRTQGNKYNVINPDNPKKPINEAPLSKVDADTLAGIVNDLETMGWDQLVEVMNSEGLDILDEYETEDQLREVITAARS